MAAAARSPAFSAWLAEEGEIEYNALLGMKLPRLDEKIIPEPSSDEIKQLLKTGGSSFAGRRDEAIIRLMVEAVAATMRSST